jgi:type IV pilus biogenesis protein CpaD/CtpE
MRSRLPLVALAAAAALTAGCGIDDPYQPDAGNTTATTAPPRAAREDEPRLSSAQRDAELRAERSAKAFLAGYLPYSYGQANARGIRAATPALRRELAANPPRVSVAAREAARRRVRQLRVSGLNGYRAYVLAQVEDGSRSYPTSLTLERHGHRWLVATVG